MCKTFKHSFANEHCCWCPSFPRRWNSCRAPAICPARQSARLMRWTTRGPKVSSTVPLAHAVARQISSPPQAQRALAPPGIAGMRGGAEPRLRHAPRAVSKGMTVLPSVQREVDGIDGELTRAGRISPLVDADLEHDGDRGARGVALGHRAP